MNDPKLYKENPQLISAQLKKKNFTFDIDLYQSLEDQRKLLQTATEELQQQRNELSKKVGQLKAKKEDATSILDKLPKINISLKDKQQELTELKQSIDNFFLQIPNIPHESVPTGTSEEDNLVVAKYGDIREFDFAVQDHVTIGQMQQQLDFQRAAKLSGSRFVVMSHDIARLQRALIQYMLDTHTAKHDYTEVYVPYLVNEESLYGTGALPKMREDLFAIAGDSGLFLIPTAEVPLTNLHRDEIIALADLPIKLVAHTPCFRSEAGSYGRDTRGIIRQHQFEKVELFQIVHPQKSYIALDELCQHAQAILQNLKLPYQVVNLCGGDLSFSSAKTYDLEVWLPSQKCYREISSCSNFIDFQTRRSQIRSKLSASEKPQLLHTVNGSALAVGRTLVAIMENYQESDGSVAVPDVLQPYMAGIKKIGSQ